MARTYLPSVFAIHLSRSREVFEALLLDRGVPTTDLYPVYAHLEPSKQQLCWAHLRHDIQAMIDRGDAGREISRELLAHADAMFEHWRRMRDWTLSRRGSPSGT